jgi:peptidylprolyl isomerase
VVDDMSQAHGTSAAVTAAASTSVDDVTVTGGEGKGDEPKLAFARPLVVDTTQREIITPGKGRRVKAGERVTVDYVAVNATDGKVFDSSYSHQKRSTFVLTRSDSIIKGLVEGLTGVNVGSRVLLAVPPFDGYGVQGVPASNIGPTDSLLFVVDVHEAGELLKRAKGTKVKPKPGLPGVTLNASGEPTVSLPAADPPASLVVQKLIKGAGKKLATGDSVTVHYKAVIWRTGGVYHSTWKSNEPATFDVGNGRVLTGLDSGLLDQTVGSQVLIVIPPDQGYGAEGKPAAGITGTDTLVFVVDILDAV